MLRLAITLLAVCACERVPLEIARTPAPEPASNVRAADYVGPDVCGECHSVQYSQWSGNLHRAMNRRATESGVIAGNFEGVEIRYAGGVARFERKDGVPTMILRSARGGETVFRVTRTIGARYIQEYVGVEVAPTPSDNEVRLPFGYWLREERWFHQQFFDSWFGPELSADGTPAIDAFEVDRTPWASRCAWCHNTYPFELRIARAQSARPRGHGPETRYRLASAPVVSGNLLKLSSLVTVGISCESCHFGGRQHAEGGPIAFAPLAAGMGSAPAAIALSGDRRDPKTINAICAQCHSAPSPRWPSGASTRNSREALDMQTGGCASAIKCTDCHDPHRRGAEAGSELAPAHVDQCTRCHAELAGAAAARAHSGHDPAAASCLDCHMPRIVQGFSGPLRTHRISSPSARQVLGGEEPDACGLCHLDRTSSQLALELARGFGDWPGAGDWGDDLDRPIGQRWLDSDKPIVRVTAAAAYARATAESKPGAAKRIASRLDEPIAYYRMRMLFALEALLGRDIAPSELDPTAAGAQRRRQLEKILETL